ncbi:MAG: hypothetical protein ABI867_01730 [Kofleriaceae bacterium]
MERAQREQQQMPDINKSAERRTRSSAEGDAESIDAKLGKLQRKLEKLRERLERFRVPAQGQAGPIRIDIRPHPAPNGGTFIDWEVHGGQ